MSGGRGPEGFRIFRGTLAQNSANEYDRKDSGASRPLDPGGDIVWSLSRSG
jgi:hypothetical protein